jgi:hypothetical protein
VLARNPCRHQGYGSHEHATDAWNGGEGPGALDGPADIPQVVHGMSVQLGRLGVGNSHTKMIRPIASAGKYFLM